MLFNIIYDIYFYKIISTWKYIKLISNVSGEQQTDIFDRLLVFLCLFAACQYFVSNFTFDQTLQMSVINGVLSRSRRLMQIFHTVYSEE